VSVLTTGEQEQYSEGSIALYPSPCTEALQINHGGDVNTIIIYAAGGNRMLSISSPNKMLTVNTVHWPVGIYFAAVHTNDNSVKVIKFVKSN